ncbi:MAG: hypothetical protein KJO97_10825, partial [Acidimicrobiia bacterium]|nr:hypothetical protein [Acidimicrobiia bacterium]
ISQIHVSDINLKYEGCQTQHQGDIGPGIRWSQVQFPALATRAITSPTGSEQMTGTLRVPWE